VQNVEPPLPERFSGEPPRFSTVISTKVLKTSVAKMPGCAGSLRKKCARSLRKKFGQEKAAPDQGGFCIQKIKTYPATSSRSF
jgi:hypothetical protein